MNLQQITEIICVQQKLPVLSAQYIWCNGNMSKFIILFYLIIIILKLKFSSTT